jgi:hypothetical protein
VTRVMELLWRTRFSTESPDMNPRVGSGVCAYDRSLGLLEDSGSSTICLHKSEPLSACWFVIRLPLLNASPRSLGRTC